MDAILKAILAHFNGNQAAGSVYAAVAGRYNFPVSPTKPTFPYIVGTVVSDTTEPLLGGSDHFRDIRFQFAIFGDDPMDAAEVVDIADKLRARFDWATIAFAGGEYATVWVEPDIGTGPDEIEDRMMMTQDYVMRFQKL